jgi:UDP-N-acetylglucosamine 2-epimerase
MAKLLVIIGTRPEAIKLSPVVHAARAGGHEVTVVTTGQHREMVYPLLSYFDAQADVDLDVMTADQSLAALSEKILRGLEQNAVVLKQSDSIIVQGDTVTAMIAAYWGFCQRIPVAHVEAGLRTYDLSAPFPEEGNRQVIARMASFHFAPTLRAAMALSREGVDQDSIFQVGNTGIDALQFVLNKIGKRSLKEIREVPALVADFVQGGKMLLVTAHRRESFGTGLNNICEGILGVLESCHDVKVIFPVHPNPRVRETVEALLSGHPRILLCQPLPYVGFIAVLKSASVILTDSGGVQEEAPTLRKPILVLRDKTERPEGVLAGFARLVGTDASLIRAATLHALDYGLEVSGPNPYGDGHSAERIVDLVTNQRTKDRTRDQSDGITVSPYGSHR